MTTLSKLVMCQIVIVLMTIWSVGGSSMCPTFVLEHGIQLTWKYIMKVFHVQPNHFNIWHLMILWWSCWLCNSYWGLVLAHCSDKAFHYFVLFPFSSRVSCLGAPSNFCTLLSKSKPLYFPSCYLSTWFYVFLSIVFP